MVDDRAERLIHRNHLLLAQAATACAASRKTAERAKEHRAILRQSQIALVHTMIRLRYRDSSPSADALFCC